METLNNYTLRREIGAGSFGKVYLAEEPKTHKRVAIKRLNKKAIDSNQYLRQAFKKEIDIMKQCKCENSVELIKFVSSNNNYNIVMELCDTDLDKFLNEGHPEGLTIPQIRSVLAQLNNVFRIMVEDKIMHRDLKLKNILVKFPSILDKEHFDVKLSDFGFSKVVDCDVTGTKLGTPTTMAPEVLMGKPYTSKADLWSLGVIIYQMLFKELPYQGKNEKMILEQITSGAPKKLPSDSLLRDLLLKLLTVEPEKRISWEEYFNHPFFGVTKYTKVQKIELGIPGCSRDYECYLGYDNAAKRQVVIKQYSNEFISRNSDKFAKELYLMKQFQGNKNAIQYINHYVEEEFTYVICEDITGVPFDTYIRSTNLTEADLQRINKEIYTNIIQVLFLRGLVLDIISTFNFVVSGSHVILFDFGLCRSVMDEKTISSYYIKDAEEVNTISVKSNIMNYGITLYKAYYMGSKIKTEVDEENKLQIVTPKYKRMSKDFMSLVTKMCTKNAEKRPSWEELAQESFLKCELPQPVEQSICEPSEPSQKILFTSERLTAIFQTLEMKYKNVIEFYETSLNSSTSEKHLNEIAELLMTVLIEMKTVKKFFTISKKEFTSDEQIAMMKIFEDGKSEQVSINFKDLNNYKVFDSSNSDVCCQITKFCFELTTIQTRLNSIISKVSQKLGKELSDASFKSFHSEQMHYYLFSLFEEGLKFYDEKRKDLAKKELEVAKVICENIILFRLYSLNKETITTDSEVIEKFFDDSNTNCINMLMSMVNKPNARDGSMFVNFLGGMLEKYYSENANEEALSTNQQNLEGLVEFYPKVIQLIDDCLI